MNTQTDQHWTSYYAEKKDFRAVSTLAISKLLSDTNDSLEKTCLDIGCGTGQLTRELYHRGYSCTGVDISTEAIALASSATIFTGLSYLHFDIESDDSTTLPRTKYSLITCKLVFAFMKDRQAFLRKVAQLLEKDGTFAIITPTHTTDTDSTPISVRFDETLTLLQENFPSVTTYSLADFTYFICRA